MPSGPAKVRRRPSAIRIGAAPTEGATYFRFLLRSCSMIFRPRLAASIAASPVSRLRRLRPQNARARSGPESWTTPRRVSQNSPLIVILQDARVCARIGVAKVHVVAPSEDSGQQRATYRPPPRVNSASVISEILSSRRYRAASGSAFDCRRWSSPPRGRQGRP